MKINLINTVNGLIPCQDSDYEQKRKLKVGGVYTFTCKLSRNYEFHKKYFALINCAWEFLTEKQQDFFKNDTDIFRKTMEIAAGHCEVVYLISKNEWSEVPKSISFEKMDEAAFSNLYQKVFDVILKYPLKDISYEYFTKNLINFI